ncbi:hypothetical protein DERP_010160 [Dermatophagoides pteronyssinus]|uniref:Uncharacterized protein n=1 Tax=Dermatophagoides pteronyssinus TaxID=6956 RepID=A0ABQ8J6T2_DERPT|nr:hypothetical protein DERP_010160 [Dermatophagoides pteronyssinus]
MIIFCIDIQNIDIESIIFCNVCFGLSNNAFVICALLLVSNMVKFTAILIGFKRLNFGGFFQS